MSKRERAGLFEEGSDRDFAGVSLWRQVSEGLAADIESGRLAPDQRLPASAELAKRFNVNRHTILKAIAHLQAEGLLRMERGRGSYAVVNPLAFRIGPQQWFEQNLRESNRTPRRTILAIEETGASAEMSKALAILPDAPVLFVAILGEADSVPVNYGHHYFPVERLVGIEAAFRAVMDKAPATFSFSDVLAKAGVKKWRRRNVRIRGRLPTRDEAKRLKVAPSDPLLVTSVISVDQSDAPIVYAKTAYGGARTELVIDL